MALLLHNDSANLVIFDGIEIQPAAALTLTDNNKVGIADDYMFIFLIFDAAQSVWVEDTTNTGVKIVQQAAIDLLKSIPVTTTTTVSSSNMYEPISAINTASGQVEIVFTDTDVMIGQII